MTNRFLTPAGELEKRLSEKRPQITHVGSGLDDLISRQFQKAPFDLAYASRGRDRKDEAKALLKEVLILKDCLGTPSEGRVLSRCERDGYAVEEVEFIGSGALKIPATVVVPLNGKTKHPSVVALHSMGGLRVFGREKLLAFEGEPSYLTDYRQVNYEGKSLQVELAKRGYLSIAIDAFNFGLRTAAACEDRKKFEADRLRFSSDEARAYTIQAGTLGEFQFQRGLLTGGLSMASLVATDDLRTVDYLVSRPDVDTARIACTGLSFGSFRTNYLAALDDRIRCGVSVCWVSTLDGIIGYNIMGAMGYFAQPPGLYQRMDMVDIIALAAPKPFLSISGWKDKLMQPAGMAQSHLLLREYWKKMGAEDKCGSLIYDTGHEYNAQMQGNALDFLDLHLK